MDRTQYNRYLRALRRKKTKERRRRNLEFLCFTIVVLIWVAVFNVAIYNSISKKIEQNYKVKMEKIEDSSKTHLKAILKHLIDGVHILSELNKNMIQERQSIKLDNVYQEFLLPDKTNGKFKTYMDFRTITNKTSKQYHLQQIAYTDNKGFRQFNDYYLVALGSFYAKEVGETFKITLENGKEFNVMIGDLKQDIHTDKKNQYIEHNGNIIEFIVDVKKLSDKSRLAGDVSHSGFEGSLVKIEKERK